MKTLPTLKQLQYLVALAEHHHFGKAAESCHVTQSTLSAGIRDLENILQSPIAERTKRTVMLTPLGEQLVVHAKKLLRMAEDMVDLAQSSREPLSGIIRLGVIPTIGPYLLPRVLPSLYEAYPNLQLYLHEDQTARLLARLEAGQLDVILMALPYDMDGMRADILLEDPFQLACPKDHSLAPSSTISHEDIALEPLMLLEEGHCLREHALSACHLEGRAKVKGVEATSLSTLVQMVSGGLGLTLLPQLAIDAGLASGLDISLVPLAGDSVSRQIGLVWRKTSPRTEEYRMLGKVLIPD